MSINIHLQDILDIPIVSISIIVILSLIIAFILFGVLNSTGILKYTGIANLDFGGGAAGFFVSMYILQRWHGNMMEDRYVKIKGKRINMKLYMAVKKKDCFNRRDGYSCRYWLFNEETHDEKEFQIGSNYWENGYLTLHIKDVSWSDWIRIRIEDSKNVWECDYVRLLAPKIELKKIENHDS